MKFSELYESNEEVLKKRAKHIYTLLRQGTLDWETEDGLVKVKYTLPSKVEFGTIELLDGNHYACIELLEEEDNDITYVDVEADDVINGQYGHYDDDNELFNLLVHKFIKFGVILLDWAYFAPYPGYDFKEAISQLMGIKTDDEDGFQDYINEDDKSVNIDLTAAQKKKAKSVYFALRTGIIKIADARIKYILPTDFYVDMGQFTKKIIIIPDEFSKNEFPVKLYLIKDDGEEIYIEQHQTNVYKNITQKIAKKFGQFDISLVF